MKKNFLSEIKYCIIIIALIFSILIPVYADVVTLNSAETLQTPTSQKLNWKIALIDATTKTMIIHYRWIDADNNTIKLNDRSGVNTWVCKDDGVDTCFSDIFGFQIRAQDVGTKIGVGLRTLIWNHFKSEVLTPGNSGTFDTN